MVPRAHYALVVSAAGTGGMQPSDRSQQITESHHTKEVWYESVPFRSILLLFILRSLRSDILQL